MPDASPTLARIARVLHDALGANVPEQDLETITRLDQLVALDSIALLQLVLGLEREFDIRLDPEHAKYHFLVEVAGLVQYLDRKAGVGSR